MEPLHARSDVRTRTVEATAAQVFAAIRDPLRLVRWWGPDGFSSTVHRFGFHPGATWSLTLHGPDGQDYPNDYRLLSVEPDRLVQIDHPSEDHHFILTIELLDDAAATTVAWQQVFDTVEQYQQLASVVARANEQVLARLCAEARREPATPDRVPRTGS